MKIDPLLSHYCEVWTLDTEYCFTDRNSGNRPTPVCLVAHEMRSNRWLRLWQHQLRRGCPFRVDDEALFVAYCSPAEWGFFLALDWPLPEMVLDLHTEFRCLNNGLPAIAGYGIFEGRTFKYDRFEAWLARNGIPWPRLQSGRLDLSDDTFRQLARAFPQVSLLRELRHTLSELRLNDLTVGADGRNRAMLSSFGAARHETRQATRVSFSGLRSGSGI